MSNNEMEAIEKGYQSTLMRLLAKYSRRVPIPIVLAAVLIGALANGQADAIWIALWVALVTSMLLIRGFVLSGALPQHSAPFKFKIQIAVLLSLLNGSVHALSLCFFPWLSDFEKAIQTLVLAGLSTGAIGTTAGHPRIYYAYIIPVMGGLLAAWYYNAYQHAFDWVYLSVVVLILLFTAVLVPLAKDSFRQFKESCAIREEQSALNRQLRSALTSAETANRAKTRFLAAASHDLRQPIHTLSLLGASMSMQTMDDKSQHITQLMNEAISSLADQMDALLDISKLDAGVIDVDYQVFDVTALIRRVVGQHRHAAKEKFLNLELSSSKPCWIKTDPMLLERIIGNLLSNAIRYTASGSISLAVTSNADSQVAIAITDTGIGISEEQVEHIFDEFYQADNPERDRKNGLGLGLAIVKRLTHLLNIKLILDSKPGTGTTFTLLTEKVLKPCAPMPEYRLIPIDWSTLNILVVDDEKLVRQATRSLLIELGASVRAADSTMQAELLVTAWQPDVLLVDYRLRGRDNGLETIRKIQKNWPDSLAILVSGDTAPQRLREVNALKLPLLHKPINLSDLQRIIGSFYADTCDNHCKKETRVVDA